MEVPGSICVVVSWGVFVSFCQEADQVHVLPGGRVRPALHGVCVPARGSQQLHVEDQDVRRAGSVVDAGK